MFDHFERAMKAWMIFCALAGAAITGTVIYLAIAIARYLGNH